MNPDLVSLERQAAQTLAKVDHQVIGARVREARVQNGLSVRDLAKAAMVSKTTIVNLEKGENCRPVTVVKICLALNIHLDRLLGTHQTTGGARVHRLEDHRWYCLSELAGSPLAEADIAAASKPLMCMFQSSTPSGKLMPGLIELTGPTELRSHPGEEFVFVVAGTALIEVEGEAYELKTGESIAFSSEAAHRYGPAKGHRQKVTLLCIRG